MVCEILDFRCIFVNEIVGNVILSIVLFAILFFIIASKTKMGFSTTMIIAIPVILILSIAIGTFSPVFAVTTIIVGILYALLIRKLLFSEN